MVLNLTTLILGAFALAASADKICVSETQYTLSMSMAADNTFVTLHAIDNGPAGTVMLVADPSLALPGTPLSDSGAAPNTHVNLDVSGLSPLTAQQGTFHLSVPDMGSRYGSAAAVLGSARYEWPHWYTTPSNIWPKQTSGAQMFWACDADINGKAYKALSWGLANSDGTGPVGCVGTIVSKMYDVQVPC